jgi:hypothetical protein
MSLNRKIPVFISYSRKNLWFARWLESQLKKHGFDVWIDYQKTKAGDSFVGRISEGLEVMAYFLVALSSQSISSQWVQKELNAALALQSSKKGCTVIPVLIERMQLPAILADTQYVDFTGDIDVALNGLIERIRGERETALSLSESAMPLGSAIDHSLTRELPEGVMSHDDLFESETRRENEIFAVELLKRPIRMKRDESGKVEITIDRTGVQECIINNKGKRAIVARYVKNRDKLLAEDEDVHDFLSNSRRKEKTLDLASLHTPLRWASGGVLSLIRLTSDPMPDRRWIPVFFRDIRPYGWNIALGASERWFLEDGETVDKSFSVQQELTGPWNLALREFLEETLILDAEPKERIKVSRRTFGIRPCDAPPAITHAARFGKEHIKRRVHDDKLDINAVGGREIPLLVRQANCDLIVGSPAGRHTTTGVLVCFSLLDLGIEVVRVVEYAIDPGDYMLDGEVLKYPKGELVRMPMALISSKYLKEVFSQPLFRNQYTPGLLPSFRVNSAPQDVITASRICDSLGSQTEMIFFDWDVEQRMRLLKSRTARNWQERMEDWYDKFGRDFVTDEGTARCVNPPRLFVPATAKILNLAVRWGFLDAT